MNSDFGNTDDSNLPLAVSDGKGQKRKGDKGEERVWLRLYETLPAQLLNVYGASAYVDKPDEEVWKHFNQPLKSGAKYMTEMCSKETERRGVGINRFVACVLEWIKYQLKDTTKKQNEILLKESMYKHLYIEIESIKEPLEYVLAPQKERQTSGAASLRSVSAQVRRGAGMVREPKKLQEDAAKVYSWLDKSTRSYVRMVMLWQGANGVSFVGSTHHRAAQCFRYQGNQCSKGGEVSLSEVQDAVTSRHSMKGIDGGAEDCADFS